MKLRFRLHVKRPLGCLAHKTPKFNLFRPGVQLEGTPTDINSSNTGYANRASSVRIGQIITALASWPCPLALGACVHTSSVSRRGGNHPCSEASQWDGFLADNAFPFLRTVSLCLSLPLFCLLACFVLLTPFFVQRMLPSLSPFVSRVRVGGPAVAALSRGQLADGAKGWDRAAPTDVVGFCSSGSSF